MVELNSKNIYSSEINHFDEYGAYWWDPQGPFKTLHHINPLRTEYIKQFISLGTQSIIDIGCGGGLFSEALAAEGAKVTGIDMSEASLKVARLHLKESGLKVAYLQQTAEDYAKCNNNIHDIVCCMELLEHVPDPELLIKACFTIAKPNGWLFFSTINRTVKSMMLAIGVAEYILHLIPKGTHHYEKLIKPSELVSVINSNQGVIMDISGMSYNPLTQKAKLTPEDLSMNYMMAVRKPAS